MNSSLSDRPVTSVQIVEGSDTKTTLRSELVRWFILLAIIPLIFVALIIYQESRDRLMAQAIYELNDSSLLVERFIQSWFDYRLTDITYQAESQINIKFLEKLIEGLKESNKKLPEYIKSTEWEDRVQGVQNDLVTYSKLYDYIYDLYLIDHQGNILYSVSRNADLGRNLRQGGLTKTKFAHAFESALSSGKVQFSDLEYYATDENALAGFLTAPLKTQLGETIGVFAMQIRIDRIQNILKKDQELFLSHYLVGFDQLLRSAYDNDKSGILKKKIETEGLKKLLNQSESTHKISLKENTTYLGPNQEKVIGLHRPIYVLGMNWILISELNASQAMALANVLGKIIFGLVVLVCASAIYLANYKAKKLSDPLTQLTKVARKVAAGEYNQKILVDVENEIKLLANAFSDMIDQRRSHEAALVEAKSLAENAASAKGDFLAVMSHEIRTPMNGVMGMLGLLKGSQLTADQRRKVDIAHTSAQSLLVLINDILDFSKIDAGKLELEELDFDLRVCLEEFAESIAYRAQEKNIEFILDAAKISGWQVRSDPGRIRQILMNLTGNAVKFTQSGEIIIRADVQEKGENTLLFTCSISDTGVGIPADKVSALFEPFNQADASTTRQFGGTGLGLAIVKQLCELMNGSVEVKSNYGKGSCFKFSLLLPKSQQKVLPIPKIKLDGLRILIVDDNETNREVLREELTNWGIEVTEASSGVEALMACENLGITGPPGKRVFDAAVLDMHMPHMDGAELGGLLKENPNYRPMKLIMMTSLVYRGDKKFFANLGFHAYFTKPYTASDLFDALSIIAEGGEILDQATPLLTSHYVRSQLREADNQVNWPESTRILVVDDNQINVEVVKGMLNELGLTADQAANGVEVLQMLRQTPKRQAYSIVLMDCQMPEMDGFQATDAIRKGKALDHNKNLTIVAMTANAMKGDKEKCVESGMDDYISKPLNSDELKDILVKWLISGSQVGSNQSKKSEVNAQSDEVHPLWDYEAVLSRLRKKERVNKLVIMFIEGTPQLMSSLNQAIESRDTSQILHDAHSIKGIAGNLSALELQRCVTEIEHQLNKNSNVDLTALKDQTNSVFQETILKFETHAKLQATCENDQQISIDVSKISGLLNQLSLQLSRGDYIESSKIEFLHSEFMSGEAKVIADKLMDQVNAFNHDEAVHTLDELKVALGFTGEPRKES